MTLYECADMNASSAFRVAIGIGCDRGASLKTFAAALDQALALCHCERRQIAVVASIDLKRNEVALLDFAQAHGWPLRFYPAPALAQVPVPNPSETVRRHTGTPAVAEAAALLAADTHAADLLVEKFKLKGEDGRNVTISIARMRN